MTEIQQTEMDAVSIVLWSFLGHVVGTDLQHLTGAIKAVVMVRWRAPNSAMMGIILQVMVAVFSAEPNWDGIALSHLVSLLANAILCAVTESGCQVAKDAMTGAMLSVMAVLPTAQWKLGHHAVQRWGGQACVRLVVTAGWRAQRYVMMAEYLAHATRVAMELYLDGHALQPREQDQLALQVLLHRIGQLEQTYR